MEAEYFRSLVNGRSGHFLYESGYHSDVWFDLETLCSRPDAIRPLIVELCTAVVEWKPEVICGPLIEGSFLALLVATEVGLRFVYAVRVAGDPDSRMFPVSYEIPAALTQAVAGKRVAVVNDVISAGSAVRGTTKSLRNIGAQVVGIASLAVLGDSFEQFAQQERIPLKFLLKMTNNMWEPKSCPLCVANVPLQKLATH